MEKCTANLISRVFEPTIVLGVLVIVGALQAGLQGGTLLLFLLEVFLVMVLPVTLLRLFLVITKRMSDWDIRQRQERIIPLTILLGLVALDYVLVLSWHSRGLTQLFGLFLGWLIGFTAITFFWKISGHASVTALAGGLVLRWFGWQWWPVLLIVPLVSWARVARGDHTAGQVVVGALYSWGLVFGAKILGY